VEGAKGLLLSNWVCVGGVVGKSSERERERERDRGREKNLMRVSLQELGVLDSQEIC